MGNSITMGKKRRGPRSSSTGNSSTSLSTTQIKEIASQLSHHPQIRNFFRNHVREAAWEDFSLSRFRRGERLSYLYCGKDHLKELGEVVAAAHEEAVAQGCREAVALALCALPGANHFTKLKMIDVPRNSGSAPFLDLLADTNTCVLEALTFGDHTHDWFGRKAEWSLLAHLILHNTTLKTLRLGQSVRKMSEEGGIALADSIRNNRGLQELWIEGTGTDAFGKEGGGLALAAMVRHNSTLRILHLSNVRVCSRGTEALAKALGANRRLRDFSISGSRPVPFGSAIARLSDCVLETLALDVDAPTADAMIKMLTTSKPSHAGGSTASSANICHSLHKLTMVVHLLDDCKMNGMDASAAADMIRSNQKLVSFTLRQATYSSLEWADTITPALHSNSTLKEFAFYECKGVDAELAYNALSRMLSDNTTLQSINLEGTPLSRAGKAEAVREDLRQNVQYRSTLAALPKIKVKSCRLVLCGNAFAGTYLASSKQALTE